MTDSKDVVVARIGKAHALRGEVTVELRTDDPQSRLAVGATLRTTAPKGSGVPKELTVATTRVHNGTWLVSFDGIPDRTGAEGLRGTMLHADVPVESAEDDGEGWYTEELVGLEVRDAAGARLGEVVDLVTRPVQDLLEVRLDDGREGLVPFVEALVPVVDVEAGFVVVTPPAGLFDLDADSAPDDADGEQE